MTEPCAVWTVGHLTLDDVVRPDGSTQMGTIGGAALYSALGARLAGARPGLASRRGAGYPDAAVAEMTAMGVRTEFVVTEDEPIHQWVLYESDGSRRYLHHPRSGTLEWLSPMPAEHRLPGAEYVHVAPLPIRAQRAWAGALAVRDLRCTLDPHADDCATDTDKVLDLVPRVHAFLPSELEARALVGADPVAAVRRFRALGAPIALVKLGARGCVLGYGAELWHVPPAKVTAVDETGAGDTFCGAFAAALAAGRDPLDAARWGCAAASFVIEAPGTALPPSAFEPAAVQERLASIHPAKLDETH